MIWNKTVKPTECQVGPWRYHHHQIDKMVMMMMMNVKPTVISGWSGPWRDSVEDSWCCSCSVNWNIWAVNNDYDAYANDDDCDDNGDDDDDDDDENW